jgi:glycosyltransferase involved in cell wall biosynthesis
LLLVTPFEEGLIVPDVSSFTLSVVVPAYNEEAVLPEFHKQMCAVLSSLNIEWEIVYIDDGSVDSTLEIMMGFDEPQVAVIELSRNFGKEVAMTAGFDHAKGDAVVVIDADLQDPPDLIPELVAKWQEGFDVVYARRKVRHGETLFKKSTAKMFYRVIQSISRVKIPEDTGDFRLLSRRAVESLNSLREQHRFMKGLFAWIGYPQVAVYYNRSPRYAGKTKWNYWRLWNFALEGITSFSIAPLKIATYVGVFISFCAFLFALFIIYKTILFGDPVKGYPSLMVVTLFLGGIQLIVLGVIGEYLGRMFNESKRRPLYLVDHLIESSLIKK